MRAIVSDAIGKKELLIGNEAIARGALEGGIKVASSYPGTPASEIIDSLAKVAKEVNIYVEWSVNEKVAAEVAAAASFAGLRSITAFKHEGLNVALDFLAHLNLIGVKAGMVVIVSDDPEGWSSPSENDSRGIIKWLNVPLFEPATPQEAKEMTKYALELSEQIGVFCVIRSTTRVSHATGNVILGSLPELKKVPYFDTSKPFLFTPITEKHTLLLKKLNKAREAFETAPFNYYEGPDKPELLIISSGVARLYSTEAVEYLGLSDKVGVLHLGTTWPLPTKLLKKFLSLSRNILVVEEVDPFLETNIKEAAWDIGLSPESVVIYGKCSGHIKSVGELNPDLVISTLIRLIKIDYKPQDIQYYNEAQQVKNLVISREILWCPGCPHRAIFWIIKNALRLDDRDGFVTGDIGCYGLDRRGTGGYLITKMAAAMGSGIGVASGLGKLMPFGFTQPIVAVCGDSTFYHAAIPALINAKYNQSNITFAILDNSTTAMTGFQPHPGVGKNALGDEAPVVDIEAICKALNIPVEVIDPYNIEQGVNKLLQLIQSEDTIRVILLRRPCTLLRPISKEERFKVWVDANKCLGEECGCNRYCVRVFKCPGLAWDRFTAKVRIDEAICIGCGLCALICPASAIKKEKLYV